ncbi:3D domain-containing protein [Acidaminococcus timonensis]|uniref:3D domain-containing protein n=1 Tax=Acidaminococcus timonensis TaxID=1871002 RepID=UPI002942D07B|nr:3D domain-containing protein [Acidaminococcus timonensis]
MRHKTYGLLLTLLLLLLMPLTVKAATVKPVAALGSKGQKVEEVQAMLSKLNYYDGDIDGEYGTGTQIAVKKFQKKNRKPQTGQVTWSIYNLMSKQSGLDFGRFRKIWTMESTGYSPQDPGVTGITYSGIPMRRGVVAVDPVLIPLGTRMYIMGYGEGYACDIGSAIKGNKIDLAFDNRGQALEWGRRRVRVYIL